MIEHKTTKRLRSSNFELLRIFCMVIIVAHHYSVHGGFSFGDSISFNRILIQFLSLGGKLGVNCFVLISGHFLCSRKTIRWKGLLKFIVQVTLFSILIYFGLVVSGNQTFAIKPAIKAIFPLLFGGWWFASTYFVLNILSPFINYFIDGVSRQTHLKCIAVLLFLWSVIPTFTTASMEGNSLTWFVLLYLIAAYMTKNQSAFFESKRIQTILFVASTILILMSVITFDILGTRFSIFSSHATYFAGMQNVLLTIQSISLFCIARLIKIGEIKPINFISAAMFGVYLIHDNGYVRKFLWVDFLKNATYQDSVFLIIHATCSILVVFAIATLLSIVYNLVIEKVVISVLDAAVNWWAKHQDSRIIVVIKNIYEKVQMIVSRYL